MVNLDASANLASSCTILLCKQYSPQSLLLKFLNSAHSFPAHHTVHTVLTVVDSGYSVVMIGGTSKKRSKCIEIDVEIWNLSGWPDDVFLS